MGFQQNHFTSDSTSVAASTGLKNYIAQGTFEAGSTIGWSLGTTGTITNGIPTGTPTFGSGASANLTISATSVSPLSGRFSMQYQHVTNQTVQGNMVATDPLQIDISDAGKVLSFKFNYLAAVNPSNGNWSGTSSNSFGVAVFDVVNNSWVGIAGGFNLVQSSGVGVATGTFQTAINTTSLRFVFYNAQQTSVVTGGGAITVVLDDFFLGPQVTSIAPAMSDWIAYNPTWTNATTNPVIGNGSISGLYNRIGDSIYVRIAIIAGSTTTFGTGGVYSFSLPPGLSIDTTKINQVSNSELGTALAFSSSSFIGSVKTNGTSNVAILTATGGALSNWGEATPFTAVSGTTYRLDFMVPIVGFSSNTVSSADTDTRVIAAHATKASVDQPGVNPNNSLVTITWSSTASPGFDTAGVFNDAGDRMIATVTGKYRVTAKIRTNGVNTLASDYALVLLKNGTTQISALSQILAIASTPINLAGTVTVDLSAGDFLQIQLYGAGNNSTSTLSVNGNPNDSFFEVERLSGPAVVQAVETTACEYATATGSIVDASTRYIDFATKISDSTNSVVGAGNGNNATATATWRFVAPVSGRYSVDAIITLIVASPFIGQDSLPAIAVDGASVIRGSRASYASATLGANTALACKVSGVVRILAGQFISITMFQSSGSTRTMEADPSSNRISIVRVGNY